MKIDETEYLDLVLEQIRCKRAWPSIRQELKNHIEDQRESFLRNGKTMEEASELAVREMGDPVQIGEALDKIHKPKIDFKLIALVIAITIFGICVQALIFPNIENNHIANTYLDKTITYNLLGAALMFFVMFFDYRIIAKHIWKFYIGYLLMAVGLIVFCMFSPNSHGYGSLLICGNVCWELYIIIFAGFLYRFRGQKEIGFLKVLGLLIINTIIITSLRLMNASLWFVTQATCIICLFGALWTEHFNINKKRKIIITISSILGLATLIIWGCKSLVEYQKARILACIHFDELIYGTDYIAYQARQAVANSGPNISSDMGVIGTRTGAYSDYVITCTFQYFGYVIGGILLLGIVILLIRTLKNGLVQPNQFGFILGSSISIFLILKSVIYMAANFGRFPGTSIDMPFLSFGFTNTVINFMFIGLVLAIYRYSDVFGNTMPEKVIKG